jgi:hypothetical protein
MSRLNAFVLLVGLGAGGCSNEQESDVVDAPSEFADRGGDGGVDVAPDVPPEDDGGVDVAPDAPPEDDGGVGCGDAGPCEWPLICAYGQGCDHPVLGCHENTCGDACEISFCGCDGATFWPAGGCCTYPEHPWAFRGRCEDRDGGVDGGDVP